MANYSEFIKVDYFEEDFGVNVIRTKYSARIYHKGFKELKAYSSYDEDILENKVNTYIAKLEYRWDKHLEKLNIIASQNEADLRTKKAKEALLEVDNILIHTLSINDAVDWESIKDFNEFAEIHPKNLYPEKFKSLQANYQHYFQQYPSKPDFLSFKPKFGLFDYILKVEKERKIKAANEKFDSELQKWQNEIDEINSKRAEYEAKVAKLKNKLENDINAWEKRNSEYKNFQNLRNAKIDKLKENYSESEPLAILEYCELVLSNSYYPDSFPKSFDLNYLENTKQLIVDYSLPNISQIPTLNEVKFIKGELKEYHISETQLLKMFDATLFKIALRTIHELFEADVNKNVQSINFNGWVNAINKATGKEENSCIMSILCNKDEFEAIHLENVDPKQCFKNLKGVSSSKLSGLNPIQPIIQVNRTDKRFTNHYEVAKDIDNSTNLASMDWEDFEHLIREVFAMEFNTNGGEVKVTQASKDGGVDAIAFDPDPIRGGKIVIQAKRYTNTVGVAAVRDLYGTVMNEGATKGILVTTADYGPDAYDFAKGKPITLMNGSNLLYLLEKHGHKARINVKEAKLTLKEIK